MTVYTFNDIGWQQVPEGWQIVYCRWISGQEYRVWFPVKGPGCGGGHAKAAHEAFKHVEGGDE